MTRIVPLLLGISIPVSLVLSLEALAATPMQRSVFRDQTCSQTCFSEDQLCITFSLSIISTIFQVISSISLALWCWYHFSAKLALATVLSGYLSVILHGVVLLLDALRYPKSYWFSTVHRQLIFTAGATFFSSVGSSIMLCELWHHRAEVVCDETQHPRHSLRYFSKYQAQLILLNSISTWYIIFGASVLSRVEGWSLDDAVYFCIVSLTTVGLGDLVPQSKGSMIFLPFYACVGLLLFGMTVFLTRQVLLEFLTLRVSLQLYKILSLWTVNEDVGIRLDPEAGWYFRLQLSF